MSRTDVGICFRVAQQLTGKTTGVICKDYGVTRQQVQRWRQADDMRLHKIEEFAEYFGLSLEQYLSLGRQQ